MTMTNLRIPVAGRTCLFGEHQEESPGEIAELGFLTERILVDI